MISRSAYQVIVFDLPPLKTRELEAAARYRVRSLSPLHPDQYHLYLDAFRRAKKFTIVAFLVLGRELPTPLTRADFPVRLPRGWPQDIVLHRTTPEGREFYVYKEGWLQAALPPVPVTRADEARAALRKEHDLPDQELSPERLPRASFPLLRPVLPVDHSWRWSGAALAVGLLLLAAGGVQYLDHLKTRNAAWAVWLKERAGSAQSGVDQEKRFKDLRGRIGFPLREVLTRLAGHWPGGVRILNLNVREGVLQIEAEASNGLQAAAELQKDPWFVSLKVVRIRPAPDGENLLLEGVLRDDR